jgi:hypothetical protein
MSLLDEHRAEGIVHALTDQSETTCSGCGESIDLDGDDDPMAVVVTLEEHRKECSEDWFDE